uniref:Conserved plasma membrane protein n=1 Tax=Steinernema glaseri TaxID=37863 RepID=A0A1I7Y664_9BILA
MLFLLTHIGLLAVRQALLISSVGSASHNNPKIMSTPLYLLAILTTLFCLSFGLKCRLSMGSREGNMVCKENQKFCITKIFKEDGSVERYCDGFMNSGHYCMVSNWLCDSELMRREENGSLAKKKFSNKRISPTKTYSIIRGFFVRLLIFVVCGLYGLAAS